MYETESFNESELKFKLLQEALEGSPAGKDLLSWVKSGMNAHSTLERLYKRTKLDLATVIEATNQINAKSLDLRLIENFTLNMIMGQFATFKVLMMRRDNYRSSRIVTVLSKNMKAPKLEFDETDPVLEKLKAVGRPLYIEDMDEAMRSSPQITELSECGVKLMLPLLKTGIEKTIDLVGLLCLGEKFGSKSLTDGELRVLALLGNMVAISLNNAQLYQRSIFDSLTGVYSRGHFDLHLHQEIVRTNRLRGEKDSASQKRATVSLTMIDIDNFKEFNDTYYHQAGDELLKMLAKTLGDNVRGGDILARYGGDEFAAVLPETNLARAMAVAERMRERVEASIIDVDGKRVGVTISVGVATFPKNASNTQELILEADKALYRAKELGKNCVQASETVATTTQTEAKTKQA
ncbi:MAG: sensor domain-containing diguanylate cyclase [Planctomycetota bacterium]|nr:sensor domain-containing diguanylate cyclase [Planctomycetota bacterium]